MKEYIDYYIKYAAKVFEKKDDKGKLNTGFMYFGIRFQGLLLESLNTYKSLGFFTLEDVVTDCGGDITELPTLLKISTYSDAGRLGLTRELSLTLIPLEAGRQVYPFNSKYNTTIPYDASLDVRKVASFLYSQTFSLGLPGNKEDYIVLPNSIVDKKSKRTTARY